MTQTNEQIKEKLLKKWEYRFLQFPSVTIENIIDDLLSLRSTEMKEVEGKIVEITERIVMDYANLSGRESANRAEFRKLTEKNIRILISHLSDNTENK